MGRGEQTDTNLAAEVKLKEQCELHTRDFCPDLPFSVLAGTL